MSTATTPMATGSRVSSVAPSRYNAVQPNSRAYKLSIVLKGRKDTDVKVNTVRDRFTQITAKIAVKFTAFKAKASKNFKAFGQKLNEFFGKIKEFFDDIGATIKFLIETPKYDF